MSTSKCMTLICFFVLTLVVSGQPGETKFFEVENPIPGKYIVVLNDDTPSGDVGAISQSLASTYGGQVGFIYSSVIRGFSIEMDSPKKANSLSEDSAVKYVTQDSELSLEGTQSNAPWNLDRIDQRNLPLNTIFNYPASGTGVLVYILDSGVNPHFLELTSWPNGGISRVWVLPGSNFVGGNGSDCNGHGTHIAGIIGGNTYGVAKETFLVPVRVYGCTQNSPASTIIAGINWINVNRVANSVVNMSFSGVINVAIDESVRNLITNGAITVVAAGNQNGDANNRSPARVREAITVSSTDINDNRAPLANFGTAVDLFAPGENITSAWMVNGEFRTLSGTSQATAHVTGVIAQRALTSGGTTPAYVDIQNRIVAVSSWNKVINRGNGSPNTLLYTGYSGGGTGNFYRHWNASLNSYLYVMGWSELGAGNYGYVLQKPEGTIDTTPGSGRGPLYRYRNQSTNDYYYTMNFSELGNGANGYIFERIEGYLMYSPQSFTVPLHRYWNPTISKHFYTSDFSELGNGANGYVYQGITGHLWGSEIF